MKFRYTILYVEDVVATVAFYETAFGIESAMIHESNDYAELATGGTKIAFSSLALMRQLAKVVADARTQDPTFEIAFETDDVPAALERALTAGAELVQGVEQMPWGQITSYVKDINGFLVEICTPVQPSP